jgi:hypothetical protein
MQRHQGECCLDTYNAPSAIDAYLLLVRKNDLDVFSPSLDPTLGVRTRVKTKVAATD